MPINAVLLKEKCVASERIADQKKEFVPSNIKFKIKEIGLNA